MDFRKRKMLIDQIASALRDCSHCPANPQNQRRPMVPYTTAGRRLFAGLLPWSWRPSDLRQIQGHQRGPGGKPADSAAGLHFLPPDRRAGNHQSNQHH